jgi:hypothetical protein
MCTSCILIRLSLAHDSLCPQSLSLPVLCHYSVSVAFKLCLCCIQILTLYLCLSLSL